MRTEDFRGLAGGVTVHPAINVGGTLAGGQLTLHLVLASGKRIDVGVDTGSSLGLGATLVTHYAGVWE
jgi:hypothetical protein